MQLIPAVRLLHDGVEVIAVPAPKRAGKPKERLPPTTLAHLRPWLLPQPLTLLLLCAPRPRDQRLVAVGGEFSDVHPLVGMERIHHAGRVDRRRANQIALLVGRDPVLFEPKRHERDLRQFWWWAEVEVQLVRLRRARRQCLGQAKRSDLLEAALGVAIQPDQARRAQDNRRVSRGKFALNAATPASPSASGAVVGHPLVSTRLASSPCFDAVHAIASRCSPYQRASRSLTPGTIPLVVTVCIGARQPHTLKRPPHHLFRGVEPPPPHFAEAYKCL
jgi:hypothetical protein